jgi:Ca2+-binding RTX toxin-like protein
MPRSFLLAAVSMLLAALAVAPAPSASAAFLPEVTCAKFGSALTITLPAGTSSAELGHSADGGVGVYFSEHRYQWWCRDDRGSVVDQGSLNDIHLVEEDDGTSTTMLLVYSDWKPVITFHNDPHDVVGVITNWWAPRPVDVEPSTAPGAATLSFDGSPASAELVMENVPRRTVFSASDVSDDTIDLTVDGAAYPGDVDIRPGGGSDVVEGGAGNDLVRLTEDEALDVLTGGAGIDELQVAMPGSIPPDSGVGAVIDPTTPGGDGVSRLDDYGAFERVMGTEGPDLFVAPESGMTAIGGQGDDTFVSGAGDDTFYGTAPGWSPSGDLDTIEWSRSDVAVSLTPGEEFDIGTGHGTDRLNEVEAITGSPHDDVLTSERVRVARPGLGNDVVTFGAGGGVLVAEPGLDGSDTASATGNRIEWDYAARTRDLSLTADGVANDGLPGEGDQLTGAVGAIIKAGAGNDVISGTEHLDEIHGGDGSDTITGSHGDDVLLGLAGNDTFLEGPAASGADYLIGGLGTDQVSYAERLGRVEVALDEVANDGSPGEGDKITDVDVIIGTVFGDRLLGSNQAEQLLGGGGPDVLGGSAGEDLLLGGGGPDVLRGNSGRDVLRGGDRGDLLYGGSDADVLRGEAGGDRIDAVDSSRDTLYGGTGTDHARRDRMDIAYSIEGTF